MTCAEAQIVLDVDDATVNSEVTYNFVTLYHQLSGTGYVIIVLAMKAARTKRIGGGFTIF